MFLRALSGLRGWRVWPMAGGAILGRRLVEEHSLARNELRRLVTFSAADVLMSPAQRELGSPIMVEERGLPFHAVVAFHAAGNAGLGELLPVGVFVAVLTKGGRSFEIRVDQLGLKIRRFVAIDAGGRTVGTHQRERRLRVVEAR